MPDIERRVEEPNVPLGGLKDELHGLVTEHRSVTDVSIRPGNGVEVDGSGFDVQYTVEGEGTNGIIERVKLVVLLLISVGLYSYIGLYFIAAYESVGPNHDLLWPFFKYVREFPYPGPAIILTVSLLLAIASAAGYAAVIVYRDEFRNGGDEYTGKLSVVVSGEDVESVTLCGSEQDEGMVEYLATRLQ